jgi:hypothetical protein
MACSREKFTLPTKCFIKYLERPPPQKDATDLYWFATATGWIKNVQENQNGLRSSGTRKFIFCAHYIERARTQVPQKCERLCKVFKAVSFPLFSQPKICTHLTFMQWMPHVPLTHPYKFDDPKIIWRGVKIMKFLIIQYVPAFCYFLFLKPIAHHFRTLLPLKRETKFHSHTKPVKLQFLYLKLYIFRQQSEYKIFWTGGYEHFPKLIHSFISSCMRLLTRIQDKIIDLRIYGK